MSQGYSPPNVNNNVNSYTPLKISVNFSYLANSYSLHHIDLKLDLWLDHDVEQCILFQDHSPPNIKY